MYKEPRHVTNIVRFLDVDLEESGRITRTFKLPCRRLLLVIHWHLLITVVSKLVRQVGLKTMKWHRVTGLARDTRQQDNKRTDVLGKSFETYQSTLIGEFVCFNLCETKQAYWLMRICKKLHHLGVENSKKKHKKHFFFHFACL